jgi:hypothetical protein
LINYFAGLQKELFGTQNLNSVYEGKIAKHMVGQELLAGSRTFIGKVQFWVREKNSQMLGSIILFRLKAM